MLCWQTQAGGVAGVGADVHPWESENQSSDALSCFSNLKLFLEISPWLMI